MFQVNTLSPSLTNKTIWNDYYTPISILTLDNTAVTMEATTTNSGEGTLNDPNRTVSGQNSMARYKLMSPAKLPISRSPCITIPAGYSPTSLLESPVLLSNMKVSFRSIWWKMYFGGKKLKMKNGLVNELWFR